MDEPDTPRRAEEYRRLLLQWAEATRADLVEAA